MRLLYERGWSGGHILDFFAMLDWMMRLPEELETELRHDIELWTERVLDAPSLDDVCAGN